MTSSNHNAAASQNRGMSNTAVLIIGVVLGLVGAGAFIMFAKQANSGKPEPTTVKTASPQTVPIADKPAETASATPATPAPAAGDDVNPAVEPEPPKPLTQDEIKQVLAIKQMLDNALKKQAQLVNDAVKDANSVSEGKAVMALDKTKLQTLSSKVKVIIDAENNFATALTNLEKALVQLVNKTTLSGPNKLRVAKGYIFSLSPQTAMAIRKANLARWTAFQQFVDFLSNNYGKWEYDAEKKNTKLLDESLGEQLKTIVTNVNNTTAAVKKAEAQHIQVLKQRQKQIAKLQQQAAADQQTAAGTTPAPATTTATDKPAQ